MLTAMIPVCSLAITSELGRCDRINAAPYSRCESNLATRSLYDERPTYLAGTATGGGIGSG